MAEKRAGEEMEAVDVHGMGRKWRFSSGMTVAEALSNVSDDMEVSAELLVLESVSIGGNIRLAKDRRLVPGHRYQMKLRREAVVKRRFGAGIAVDPHNFYYVPPAVDDLVSDLKAGKYCVLCGPRQSGKSTMVMAAKRRLLSESEATVVYLDGLEGARLTWGSSDLWYYICQSLHMKCPVFFPARNKEEVCSPLDFKALFLKTKLPTRVTLVLDEADTLLDLSPSCISEFFATVRAIKNDSNSYNLFGFLLVGVETVRDLLEAQYHCCRIDDALGKGRVYVPGSTRLSPFPHDHVLPSTRFSVEDIVSLLQQAAADLANVEIDIDEIVESIVAWTGGHKGLTGTCLAYLVQEKLWKFKDWIRRAESYRLGTYIFGQATYNRILEYVRKQATIAEAYDVLLQYLQAEGHYIDRGMFIKLRDFIAHGILDATEVEEEDGRSTTYYVRISTPLLRTALLRGCVITSEAVDRPPSDTVVDRKWLLLQAIKTLDGEVMCQPGPSEYSQQFLFMCRLKAILNQAYPLVKVAVLPEVKEVMVPGLKRSQLRLDGLVRDGPGFAKFGTEFVADGTPADILGHIEKSIKYRDQHSAQVFVINFCMEKAVEHLVVPSDDSITFVSVNFRPSMKSVTVTMIDATSTRDVVQLPLRKWSAHFSFDTLY